MDARYNDIVCMLLLVFDLTTFLRSENAINCVYTEYDIAFHEGTVYMSEDTGLDVSHEVYGGLEGQTACWGKNYVVSGQQLWHVEANYGVSGQITSCRGNNYVVSRQITSCRGNLRLVEANYGMSGTNYVVSRQITSCRVKLRRVGANYDVSGQITCFVHFCALDVPLTRQIILYWGRNASYLNCVYILPDDLELD